MLGIKPVSPFVLLDVHFILGVRKKLHHIFYWSIFLLKLVVLGEMVQDNPSDFLDCVRIFVLPFWTLSIYAYFLLLFIDRLILISIEIPIGIILL